MRPVKGAKLLLKRESWQLMKRLVAIIGAPSSGKTTLVNALKGRGFNIIEEQPRKFIPRFDMENDRLSFQKKVFSELVRLEGEAEGLTFTDTGRFCNLAYLKYYGLPVPEVFEPHLDFSYHRVFEAEVLPFVDDGVRREKDSERIARLIRKEYVKRGMEPIRVGGTTEERVEKVLESLSL